MIAKTLKIRGYHCDSYGHVNNARYLELLEEARWQALDPLLHSRYFVENKLLFIVVNINVNYKAEVIPNDIVDITVDVESYGRKSITFYQKIVNQRSGKIAVDAHVKFVLLNEDTKQMVTVDDELKELFNQLKNED